LKAHCCWDKDQIDIGECILLREGDEELLFNPRKRILSRCLECPRFMTDLANLDLADGKLRDIIEYSLDEIQAQRLKIRDLSNEIETRNIEFNFLHEISTAIQVSLDLDEVIAMALTAVTAGQGFGFNRAFLLLVDKDRQDLNGYFAMGPRSGEDAGRIWQEIEQQHTSLTEMAQLFFEKKMSAEREKFGDILQRLSVPLKNKDHLFVRVLNETGSYHVVNLDQEPGLPLEVAEILGVREMVMVPLKSRNRRIGMLLADNAITCRPITDQDTRSLETYALPLSFAIERAALHEQIQEELGKVREGNRRLQEQQDLMLRMEKMALVGQITSSIAHSIRNPLTIIGGFARSLSKNMPPEDSRRSYIESIVREARKLEDVLQEVLNYSESMHPTIDLWDANQLVTRVFGNLREDMEMNQVTGKLDLDQDLAPIRLDYKQISYCLRNIMTNVIQAREKGGELRVSTRCRDSRLEIVVADLEPGISPESLKAAATPFFSTKAEGSGLGLSLVSRIVEGHGGRLQIDDYPEGIRFTLILPALSGCRIDENG